MCIKVWSLKFCICGEIGSWGYGIILMFGVFFCSGVGFRVRFFIVFDVGFDLFWICFIVLYNLMLCELFDFWLLV